MDKSTPAHRYWSHNIRIVCGLLLIWAIISLGISTIWVDYFDRFRIGGFKLGFWFAHQGSILVFVVLTWIYAWLMNRLDRRFNLDEIDS